MLITEDLNDACFVAFPEDRNSLGSTAPKVSPDSGLTEYFTPDFSPQLASDIVAQSIGDVMILVILSTCY